ncbi:hypothetical protein SKAU_G00180780 [Synaphobranchus kaupii]|uniref:Uncharacterized protein n=1 Tax=Synaphobranchus kaupii TaxID=118154 RepID=A0A9Q1FM59_SYNKA|nr:hypothetical protein SKAU_G00180780 [Synaphobranchus kaupii]
MQNNCIITKDPPPYFIRGAGLKTFGFDVAEGVNNPHFPEDYGIFVSRVDLSGQRKPCRLKTEGKQLPAEDK